MFSFFKKKKTDPGKELKKILAGYELPSFPAAISQVLEKIRDKESSAADIAESISVDPGLTVRVLKVANSAAFSPARKIENLTQAIALVGMSQLESLVLSVVVSSNIPSNSAPGYDNKEFWTAAARRGIAARSLAKVICPAKEAECFSAGFLQDMAIPFLVNQMPDRYGEILNQWHSGEGPLNELEKNHFEWDHAEVATWICSKWNLPESIASAIGGHHDMQNQFYECPPPVSIISYIGHKEDPNAIEKIIENGTKQYGIKKEKLEEIIEKSFEEANDFARQIL